MYHFIAKRVARRNFERVNANDHAAILTSCAPDIHHPFAGDHALGGERHDRAALERWFGRLGRVSPTLQLTVEDVWVSGGPWDTHFTIRWRAAATNADNSSYHNRGVHIVNMKWGKVMSIDAHEDSQAVAESMRRQAAAGIAEAAAPPILS